MKTYLKDGRWGRFLLLRGDMISEFVNLYGEWCEGEVELFKLIVSENSAVVEVGSNIGMHAIPLSKLCPSGKIFCYEPQRVIFQILNANLALNQCTNVVSRHCAVGDSHEWIDIQTSTYDENWNYGSFSLKSGFSTEGEFRGATGSEPVELVRLDDEDARQSFGDVRLLKIDAEGFECEVIAGARKLIGRCRPWMFVENNSAANFPALMSSVTALDYNPYWFVSQRFRENNFAGSRWRIPGQDANMICVPKEAEQPARLTPVTDFAQLTSGELTVY